MLADGSADYTKALGLELDLTARGMGVRCQRFSMLVDDGVVKTLNIEAPGKYEVSDARDDAEAARLSRLARLKPRACKRDAAACALCGPASARIGRQRSFATMPSSCSRLE